MAAKSWAHAISGNWTTSADWAGGTPTSADDVTITPIGNYTVTVSGVASANSIAFNAPGAQLVETTAGALHVVAALTIDGGTVSLSGANTFGGTSTSFGTVGLFFDAGELDIGNAAAVGTQGLWWTGGLLLGTVTETLANYIEFGGDSTIAAAHGTTFDVASGGSHILGDATGPHTVTVGTVGNDGTVIWEGSPDAEGVGGGGLNLDIAYGTLVGAQFASLFYSSVLVDQGATLDMGGGSGTLTNLTGSGAISNSGVASNLALAGMATFYGTISGAISLSMSNTDATLGTCTYVGSTSLQSSTLTLVTLFQLSTDDGITTDGNGTGSTITNDGVFEKIGGTGTSTVTTNEFSNNGEIDLLSGNLAFNAALTNNGTLDARSGQISIGGSFVNHGVIHGVLSSSGGTTMITANAPGQSTWFGSVDSNLFTLSGAVTFVDGGAGTDTIELTGNATFAAGSVLNVENFDIDDGVSANLAALHNGETIYVESAVGGGAAVTGTKAGDAITGGSGDDTIGGGGGNDIIDMGANLTAADKVDGGLGSDTVKLNGDYSLSRAVAFGSATMVNVETLVLAAGHTYSLTTNNANVAAGQRLTVDASALLSSNALIFNGAAETNGAFTFLAGAGANTLTGGAGADFFSFAPATFGTNDTVNGGAGTALDRITFTAAANVTASAFAHVSHVEQLVLANATNSVTLADAMVGLSDDSHRLSVYGGTGNDTVNASAVTTAANHLYIQAGSGNDNLTGGAGADVFAFASADLNASDHVNGGTGASIDSLDFLTAGTVAAASLANVSHIEKFIFAAGNHTITLSDALVTSADDSHLLTLVGNSGIDTFIASNVTTATNSVRFEGLGGADKFTFGTGGAETALYIAVSDSTGNATGTLYDSFVHFRAGTDKIDLPTAQLPTSIATPVSASLSSASFDNDLQAVLGTGHPNALAAHAAVLFHASAGTLSGHDFLVVNATGTAGYVSGADYVFDITGYTGTVATSTFI